MVDIFHNGDMAIMPTVSWENTNRSHFENQAAIESGGQFLASQGWLNLHLQSDYREVPLRALNMGKLAQSMRGDYTVTALSSLSNSGLGRSYNQDVQQFLENDLINYMNSSYNLMSSGSDNRQLLYRHGVKLLEDLDILSDINADTYQTENGAVYPSSGLADDLKNAAQLIKADMGLEVISVGVGGWDTHSNQGGAEENGALSKKLEDFSDSIGAFYTDLGEKMQDVLILTMSEFGRSAKVNANIGTDHGHAASWFVIGKSVQGSVYGEWPGLFADQLNRGRYLNDTIDFRNIMAEVLLNHLQNQNVDQALSGFSDYNPLGFLG